MFWIEKKCPFVVQDWVWLKQIGLWTEKTWATDRKNCVIVEDSFSNVSFHSRPFSFLLRMIHDQKWTRFKEHSFMFFCSFLSFLFIFTASFSTYQVWLWYNKWFEPRSEVWLCSLIISFIHQVCLGGWASAQTSSSRYRYVDVLKIALNIEKKQHHFGLLLGVEDTVDVKQ